jgi:hypothetical protein
VCVCARPRARTITLVPVCKTFSNNSKHVRKHDGQQRICEANFNMDFPSTGTGFIVVVCLSGCFKIYTNTPVMPD